MEKSKKSLAFTLAEVLIVLGIIGIVAALTIPTLMANVQKQQYVTALKKFYSTQTEGYARMLAEENVEKLEDTEAFQTLPEWGCALYNATNSDCKPFFTALKKYFNFSIITPENSDAHFIVFADGSTINYAGFYKTADTNKTE